MISTLIDLLGNFYARNDFANVETIARSLLAAVPNDLVALQFLGLAYYRSGRIKDAAHIFDKVIHRRAAWAAEDANGTDTAQGDSAAAACYEEATRDNPHLGKAWYDLGNALLALGKDEQAIPAFRSALITQPENTPAMLSIGQTALRMDDLTTAEDGFSRLREIEPNNADAYHGLAQVYRKRRDFATARACLTWVRVLRRGIDSIKNRRRSGRAKRTLVEES